MMGIKSWMSGSTVQGWNNMFQQNNCTFEHPNTVKRRAMEDKRSIYELLPEIEGDGFGVCSRQ